MSDLALRCGARDSYMSDLALRCGARDSYMSDLALRCGARDSYVYINTDDGWNLFNRSSSTNGQPITIVEKSKRRDIWIRDVFWSQKHVSNPA